MELTYYGHSCFLTTINGTRLLFDPFISPNPLAQHIDLSTIKADYILLSHGHGDHVADVEALAKQNNATIIGQPEVTKWFAKKGVEKALEMNIGGKLKLDFGTVKMVTAVHSSAMPDGSYGGNPGGYVIQSPETAFYFAGDTALTYDMKLIGDQYKLNFALLPIGDNYTMGIEDALTAADFVKADQIIAMHYDSFPAIKIDRETVSDLAKKANKTLTFMEIGQTIIL